MSYLYNSIGLRPSEMQSYNMLRPSLNSNYRSRPRKTKPIVETGLRALSTYDLKCLCYKKDALAIAEYERRLWRRA